MSCLWDEVVQREREDLVSLKHVSLVGMLNCSSSSSHHWYRVCLRRKDLQPHPNHTAAGVLECFILLAFSRPSLFPSFLRARVFWIRTSTRSKPRCNTGVKFCTFTSDPSLNHGAERTRVMRVGLEFEESEDKVLWLAGVLFEIDYINITIIINTSVTLTLPYNKRNSLFFVLFPHLNSIHY